MKRVHTVTFLEPEQESTLILNYYDSIRKSTPRPGSGWIIGGVDSTNTSPQPTPSSSPKSNKKRVIHEEVVEETSKQLSSLCISKSSGCIFQLSDRSLSSMTNLYASTLPRALSLKSMTSTPRSSAEELILVPDNTIPKSKPIAIVKNKTGNGKARYFNS